MSDTPNNANERVERLLRRWGAEEARRAAGDRLAPLPGVPRRRVWSRVLWWTMPAAAAAALIVVAVGVWSSHLRAPSQANDESADRQRKVAHAPQAPEATKMTRTPKTRPADGELNTLKGEITALRKDLERREVELAAAEKAKRELAATLDEAMHGARERELAEARRRAEQAEKRLAQLGTASTGIDQRAEELARRVDALEDKFAAARREAEQLADARDTAAAGAARAAERLAAATKELRRMRRMHDEALATARDAKAELSRIRAGHAAARARMRRAYIAALAGASDDAAPERTAHGGDEAARTVDLAGCRRAARRADIAGRAAALATRSRAPDQRRLLDAVEIVFTRLDLLDPYAPQAAASFEELLTQTGIRGRIARARDDANVAGKVATLLFEADMILEAAERAA
ncbi:MAG: hypothetical protein KGY99_08090 [Phycisphaerae bacterium]|nr:hypothetical protein [Phycisphaerae bacterium]